MTNEMAEAIKLAMDAEMNAARFYTDAAEKTKDPAGRDMFSQLAEFERKHFKNLKHLLEAGGEKFGGYAGTSFGEVKPEAPHVALDAGDRQTDLDAINAAIAAEKKAHTSYRSLAEMSVDEKVKDFFGKLAEEEDLHRRILEDQFLELSNRGYWTWGE